MVDSKSTDQNGLSSKKGESFLASSGVHASLTAPSAIIGSKIRIRGELVGEEDLLIEGAVEGTIDLKENNLNIGKDGLIKANASAKIITVEGHVDGDLFASERIVILESSNVKGNLVANRVSLEDGAKFKGSIDMDVESKDPDLLKPKFAEFADQSTTDALGGKLSKKDKDMHKLASSNGAVENASDKNKANNRGK